MEIFVLKSDEVAAQGVRMATLIIFLVGTSVLMTAM